MRFKCQECYRRFTDEPECSSCPNCGSGCVKEVKEPKKPVAYMYKTKPIDYTGCDPVIADHLKRGEAILCNVGHGQEEYVTQYGDELYNTENGFWFTTAKPIEQTQYVKKASEIVKWLEDNGWKFYNATNHAYWYTNDTIGGDCKFFASMFAFCGDEKTDYHSWLPEWLEYK